MIGVSLLSVEGLSEDLDFPLLQELLELVAFKVGSSHLAVELPEELHQSQVRDPFPIKSPFLLVVLVVHGCPELNFPLPCASGTNALGEWVGFTR